MTIRELRKLIKGMPSDRMIMYHSYYKGCSLSSYDIDNTWISKDGHLVMNPALDYDNRVALFKEDGE